MFLKRSAMMYFKNPTMELAVSLMDLKGEIKINAPGFLFAARKTAGPEPIDLPQTTMSFSCTPSLFTKKSKTVKESCSIASADFSL